MNLDPLIEYSAKTAGASVVVLVLILLIYVFKLDPPNAYFNRVLDTLFFILTYVLLVSASVAATAWIFSL